jgi:hypothetical protein
LGFRLYQLGQLCAHDGGYLVTVQARHLRLLLRGQLLTHQLAHLLLCKQRLLHCWRSWGGPACEVAR